MDFVGSPLSCPPSPGYCTSSTSSDFHIPSWSSSTLCYQIISSCKFPIFITQKLLNSPPLCHCPSPAFSSIKLLSFILFSNSVYTVLLLSPLLIFILPSQTCPLPPPHIHKHFFLFSPAILWHAYPLILYLSIPLFTTTHHTFMLLPSSYPVHLLTCWLFFTPVYSSLLSSMTSTPITDSEGGAVHHYSSSSVTKLSYFLSLGMLLQPCSSAGVGT